MKTSFSALAVGLLLLLVVLYSALLVRTDYEREAVFRDALEPETGAAPAYVALVREAADLLQEPGQPGVDEDSEEDAADTTAGAGALDEQVQELLWAFVFAPYGLSPLCQPRTAWSEDTRAWVEAFERHAAPHVEELRDRFSRGDFSYFGVPERPLLSNDFAIAIEKQLYDRAWEDVVAMTHLPALAFRVSWRLRPYCGMAAVREVGTDFAGASTGA